MTTLNQITTQTKRISLLEFSEVRAEIKHSVGFGVNIEHYDDIDNKFKSERFDSFNTIGEAQISFELETYFLLN